MDGTYYKVGLFVLLASIVLVVGAGFLGAGAMKKEEFLVETYLNEAVSGLDVGAVVKYRGVPVGSLKDITFVSRDYPTEKPYVQLVLAFDMKKLTPAPGEDIEQTITDAIAKGVRARLASGGLTGAAYIEVDTHEEDQLDWDPPLEVTWEPRHLYLPSVPSTMTRLQQGAEKVLKQFTDADLPGLVGDIRKLIQGVDEDLRSGLGPTLENLESSSAELTATISEIKKYIADDLRPQTTEFTGALTDLVKKDLSPAIQTLDRKIGSVADNLDRLVTDLHHTVKQDINPTMKNIRIASDGLPTAVDTVNSTLRGIDIFAGSERGRIDEALENIRVVTADLRQLVEALKRDPSRALFGEAPPRIERGGRR